MRLFYFAILIVLSACMQTGNTTQKVDMYNTAGDLVGTATFNEAAEGVKIKVKVEGLSPGFHGIHIHEFPKCEGPDFKTAGNHFNPEGKEHGLMHPKGAHIGDLPNIEVDSTGTVEIELMAQGATLLEGKKSILQNEGTSLIIDQEQDDGVSQPSGNSGVREICGVLKKDESKSKQSPTDPTEFNEKEDES